MKKSCLFTFWLITFLLPLSLLQAQELGVIYDNHVQERKLSNFNAIKVSSAIDLYLTQSDNCKVAVSATNNEIRDHIITVVEDGTLIISLGERGNWMDWKKWGNYKTKAYVSVADLNALSAGGASDIHILTALDQPKLKISLTGASDIKGTIRAGSLLIDATGASNVELKGNVNELLIRMTGASNADLYQLETKAADISVTGASVVKVNVSEIIKVQATGASDVNYKGSPTIKQINSKGASSVRRRD